jgi:hypothetical protein
MKSLEKNHHLTFYQCRSRLGNETFVETAKIREILLLHTYMPLDRQAYIHAPQLISVCKSGTGLESGEADIATAKRYVRWQIWDSTGRREMYVYAYGWHACAAYISILHHLPDP